MARLNVYFSHSTKFDYKNILYKKILSSPVCLAQNLILPMSEENKSKYIKDLINEADIIIVNLSNPNFWHKLELKWILKANKPTLYVSDDNILPKTYKKLVPNFTLTDDNNTYISVIENFIKQNLELKEAKDKPQVLGEI
mgnify:CR=1 FL=1